MVKTVISSRILFLNTTNKVVRLLSDVGLLVINLILSSLSLLSFILGENIHLHYQVIPVINQDTFPFLRKLRIICDIIREYPTTSGTSNLAATVFEVSDLVPDLVNPGFYHSRAPDVLVDRL